MISFDAYPSELPQVVTDWINGDREARWLEIEIGFLDPEYDYNDVIIDLQPSWTVKAHEYVWCGEEARGHRLDTAVGVGSTLHDAALVAWKFMMADH